MQRSSPSHRTQHKIFSLLYIELLRLCYTGSPEFSNTILLCTTVTHSLFIKQLAQSKHLPLRPGHMLPAARDCPGGRPRTTLFPFPESTLTCKSISHLLRPHFTAETVITCIFPQRQSAITKESIIQLKESILHHNVISLCIDNAPFSIVPDQ